MYYKVKLPNGMIFEAANNTNSHTLDNNIKRKKGVTVTVHSPSFTCVSKRFIYRPTSRGFPGCLIITRQNVLKTNSYHFLSLSFRLQPRTSSSINLRNKIRTRNDRTTCV